MSWIEKSEDKFIESVIQTISVLSGLIAMLLFSPEGYGEIKIIVFFVIGVLLFNTLFLGYITTLQDLLKIVKTIREKMKNKKSIIIPEISQKKEEKKDLSSNQIVAKQYTQKVFENYIEKEDLETLCQEVIAFSNEKTDFSKSKPIKVKDLANNDLYHFGWNIWNHFKNEKQIKQEVIVDFLKIIFSEKLKNVDEKTIKSHLKDNEKAGKIKIEKKLFVLESNKNQ